MPRTLIRLLALLATAALLLGACGDDDGDDGAAPTTEAPAATGDDSASDDDDTTTTEAPTTTVAAGGSGSSGMPSVASLAGVDDFCTLFAMFDDVDDPFEIAEDPAATPEEASAQMAEAFTFIQAFFARAVQLSPGEIRTDVALFAEVMQEYNELLAEYDYDFMGVAMASMSDPEIEARFERLDSAEFDAAATRIEDYVFDECGIDLS